MEEPRVSSYSPCYPDGLSGAAICYMEGCEGRGHCPRCGKTNYRLLGYFGALARWAKAWRVSEEEAEERFVQHTLAREEGKT